VLPANSAFSLVWHQDAAIKAEMLSAFSAVYLTDGAGENAEALAAEEVAQNLMHLVRHCDAAEVSHAVCSVCAAASCNELRYCSLLTSTFCVAVARNQLSFLSRFCRFR
jgi:hypothetical protein